MALQSVLRAVCAITPVVAGSEGRCDARSRCRTERVASSCFRVLHVRFVCEFSYFRGIV